MVGNNINSRIAAFEHLAETSKAQSGIMQIVPNPATGFSSLKTKETVAIGKEIYAASVTNSPYVVHAYPGQKGNSEVCSNQIEIGQEEGRNDKNTLHDAAALHAALSAALNEPEDLEKDQNSRITHSLDNVSSNLEESDKRDPFEKLFNEFSHEKENESNKLSSFKQPAQHPSLQPMDQQSMLQYQQYPMLQQPIQYQSMQQQPIQQQPMQQQPMQQQPMQQQPMQQQPMQQQTMQQQTMQQKPDNNQERRLDQVSLLITSAVRNVREENQLTTMNQPVDQPAENQEVAVEPLQSFYMGQENSLEASDTKEKSFREILDEEDKMFELDEDGPITEITMKSYDENEADEDDDTRDVDSVSPLSFMDHKIDDRHRVKNQHHQQLNPDINTIDENEELSNIQPNCGNEEMNPVSRDTLQKPIMNPIDVHADDFFACFDIDDQMEMKQNIHTQSFLHNQVQHVNTQQVSDQNNYQNPSSYDGNGENQDSYKSKEKEQNVDAHDDDTSLQEYFEALLSDEPTAENNYINNRMMPANDNGLVNDTSNTAQYSDMDINNMEDKHQDDSDEVGPSPSAQLLESKFDNLWNEHTSLKSQSATPQNANDNEEVMMDNYAMNHKIKNVQDFNEQASVTLTNKSRSLLQSAQTGFLHPDNGFVHISDCLSKEQVDHELSEDKDNSNSNHTNLSQINRTGEGIFENQKRQSVDDNYKISENIDNKSAYSMYSTRSVEDELKPVATVSFDSNLQENSSNRSSKIMSDSIVEQDDISDTTPFAGINYDDILGELEEENFVNKLNPTDDQAQNTVLQANEEQRFSYLNPKTNDIPQNRPQTNATANGADNYFPSPTEIHVDQGFGTLQHGTHDVNQRNRPENPMETSITQSSSNEVQTIAPADKPLPRHHQKSSGPPLTFKNSHAFFQYEDCETESLGVSVLTEETFGTNFNQKRNFNDEASMLYSVSEKSHTSSTSISQGGQKPKKRPISGNSDPSKPVPIFRTASALRDNPNLYHNNSTISELTGMDNMSVASAGRRQSASSNIGTQYLSTINANHIESKSDISRNRRGSSPFGRRIDNESIVSSGTKSSIHQLSLGNSETLKHSDSRKEGQRRRGFSFRSLSPWRSFKKKDRNDDNEPYKFTNPNEKPSHNKPSRGRSKTRISLQRTPSQMLLEEERAETSVPLVDVNSSQDSSVAKKPSRGWSILRSLSPFTRFRSRRNATKNDPFYEDASL